MQCVAADVTVACDVALSLRPNRRLYLGIVKPRTLACQPGRISQKVARGCADTDWPRTEDLPGPSLDRTPAGLTWREAYAP